LLNKKHAGQNFKKTKFSKEIIPSTTITFQSKKNLQASNFANIQVLDVPPLNAAIYLDLSVGIVTNWNILY
jgi:hypothetical protein